MAILSQYRYSTDYCSVVHGEEATWVGDFFNEACLIGALNAGARGAGPCFSSGGDGDGAAFPATNHGHIASVAAFCTAF